MHSISYETKLKLKDLFVCLAEEEVRIERLRQVLASIPEFEPYAAFKRIDRTSSGILTSKSICRYLRENGYRELENEDVEYLVRYFDQDDDMKLSFHDFLQILLPCENAVLRADVSQRPTFRIAKDELLPVRVEQALTTLLLREVKLQIKSENIKRSLEGQYDFNIQSAYKVIDDWSYGYLDARNLRRFLRNMGVLMQKSELVALIRRIDLDGDAKVSYEEFFEGVKSQFSLINRVGKGIKAKGILSTHNGNTSTMIKSRSRQELSANTRSSMTPIKKKDNKIKIKRPQSAVKTSKRTKKLQYSFAQPTCPCQNHHHEEPHAIPEVKYQQRDYDFDSSPSGRLSKSVSFNNQVKVREIDTQQRLSASPYRLDQVVHNNNNGTVTSNPFASRCFPPAQQEADNPYHQRMASSPLRQKSTGSFFGEQFNSAARGDNQYMSPVVRNEAQEYSSNRQTASPMINQARTSPLKRIQPSIQRSLTYNFTPEKIPVPEPDCQPAFDKFDKVEQEESHKMLKEIIFMERELESAKIELSLKPDFNLLDAFKMLDHHNKGWISFSELVEVLNRLFDIDTISFAGRELLDLVFKRYDTNRDQKLSLAEFCKAFTPSGKEYAALVQGRAEFYAKRGIYPGDFFNSDTRREIRTVWEVLIHTEKMTERLRHKLAGRPLFNLRSAFKYVDRDQNGAITHLDLRDSLVSHGFYATEKEIQLIMNKFDKFSDNKITMTDFIDEMVPKTRG